MTRRRRFLVGLAMLVMGSWATAGEQIRIEMPIFEGGEGLSFFSHCAREYEKARPGVIMDLYGDPRIVDKVRIRILEGTYPEITNAPGLNYWVLIRSGDILALDEFLDGPNWEGDRTWRESFLSGILDRYTWNGKVYGIPLSYSAYTVWYNKGMFEKHGWKPPVTWDEFFQLSQAIKDAGIAPLAFQGRYPGYIHGVIDSAYYHLAGRERFYAQQELIPGSFDNPEMVQALALVQKTAQECFQAGAMGMSHTESQMQFLLGKAAMIFCGPWLKSEMMGKIPEGFRFGCFNVPVVPDSKGDPTAVNVGASYYYFVMARSSRPREGVDFLRFMTSRAMASTFARQRDMPVAIRGANEGNLSEDLAELTTIIKRARTSYGTAPGEGFPGMEQYWSDVRFNLLTGKIKPEAAAAFLQKSAKAVLNRAENPDRIIIRHIWEPVVLLSVLGGAIIYWAVTTILNVRARRTGAVASTAGRLRLEWYNIPLFVGPAVLLYTVFVMVPCIKSFAWSTQQWDGLTDMTYKGLLHFKRLLFESDGFWVALKNNLFLMFVIPLFVLPLSLFLAACLSRPVKGAAVLRIVFFFPNILGAVAATLLWMHMYNPQGGVMNVALVGIGKGLSAVGLAGLGTWFQGFQGFAWLSQDHLYWAIIPMSIWGGCGFNMLLFLAAMEGIPPSIYEAAELDGTSHWQQFWHITFPLIWEMLSISIVFMVIGGMKAFEVIWLLTNQGPTTGTHVIGTRMVQTMFAEFKVGEATAIAVLLFLMVFFGTTATLRLMKREAVEY